MPKVIKFMRKNIIYFIVFFCFLIFLLLAEDVYTKEIMSLDIIGYDFIRNYLINDFSTPIMKIITMFGNAVILLSFTLILLFLFKDRNINKSIVFNLIIATTLNILFKNILQRPRPTDFRIIEETGYSFPSGHSMISMAFYGFLFI